MRTLLVELIWNEKARVCTCAVTGKSFSQPRGLMVSLRGREAPISPAYIASVDAYAAAKFERLNREAVLVVDMMARNQRPYTPMIPEEHFTMPE